MTMLFECEHRGQHFDPHVRRVPVAAGQALDRTDAFGITITINIGDMPHPSTSHECGVRANGYRTRGSILDVAYHSTTHAALQLVRTAAFTARGVFHLT